MVNNLKTGVEMAHKLSRALEDDAGEDVELEGFHNFSDGSEKRREVIATTSPTNERSAWTELHLRTARQHHRNDSFFLLLSLPSAKKKS